MSAQTSLPLAPYEPPRFRVDLVAEPSAALAEPAAMGSPDAVVAVMSRHLTAPVEQMAVVALDTRNRMIGWALVGQGTINRAAVEPRLALQFALLLNAAGLILVHTHPSGDPSPSAEDLAYTRRMAEAGELVGVRLLDHIILASGAERHVSLKQRGGW